MNGYVTGTECERIRALRRKGVSLSKIANRFGRHQSTVIVHAHEKCTHMTDSRQAVDATGLTIVTAIKRLADELQEVPAKKTWEQWDDRVCSVDTVVDRLGSWEAALDAAELPVIADNAPQLVRKAAYQRPDLTTSIHD